MNPEEPQSPELAEAAAEEGGITFSEFVPFAWEILTDGGWLMIPLGLLALMIYFEAMSIVLRLAKAKVKKTPRTVWGDWIDDPEKGSGHIGEVIRYVVGDGIKTEESLLRVEAVRGRLIPEINARIVVLSVLVTIAPLMGLLGTVIGMLTTFRGLAVASGQAIDLVAEGIRVALITTQTGLMIAIPGYIFISLAIRSRNVYMGFLAELETVVVQRLHQLDKPQ
ncbi:MAG: MotA/TolQ/ExbB proton channel family protein [Opitutales bacterium]|nr:MotA/TolQ/ExbB proton channel family protein [Opitutales bacterium]